MNWSLLQNIHRRTHVRAPRINFLKRSRPSVAELKAGERRLVSSTGVQHMCPTLASIIKSTICYRPLNVSPCLAKPWAVVSVMQSSGLCCRVGLRDSCVIARKRNLTEPRRYRASMYIFYITASSFLLEYDQCHMPLLV